MTVNEAQQDMRHGYYGGGPGVLVSGVVWCVAGTAAAFMSARTGMIVLFVGGMLIFPLGSALAKALKRPGAHTKGNPLANLAFESTVLLFIGLFLSYAVTQIAFGWFFPMMLSVIGARYFLFSTLYGRRLFWALGAVLAAAGILGLMLQLPATLLAIGGGLAELVAAGLIITNERNSV